jgi:hypothetical protein
MSIKNLLGYEVRELFGKKLTIVVPKFPSFRHSILAGPDFSPRAWKGGGAKAAVKTDLTEILYQSQ